jgi:ribosomal protein S18 acetylase RimI-like enzyme
MKITHMDIADAGELAQVYNEQIADIPHCYSVSREEFETGFLTIKDRHCRETHSAKVIIGEEDDEIIGFAHVAMGEIRMDEVHTGGIIHFMTYKPGHRPTGQAILDESEKYLMNRGADKIWAYQKHCGYRFYHLEFGNLSDRKGHIYGLFRNNGYEINDGEIFMEDPEYSEEEPMLNDRGIEIIIDQKSPERAELPGITVRAFRAGEVIGVCEAVSAGECCPVHEAQQTFFIDWLGVDPAEQGKGLGRYLLQRARWEMKKIGYRNAVISTDITNYRALTFYTNYGYRVTDTVYGLVACKT